MSVVVSFLPERYARSQFYGRQSGFDDEQIGRIECPISDN